MAALAIPIVVLGSLYILSEQEKNKKSDYQNVGKREFFKGDSSSSSSSSSSSKKEGMANYNSGLGQGQENNSFIATQTNPRYLANGYVNSNQHTDKFFNGSINNDTREQNMNISTNTNSHTSLNRPNINLMSGQQVEQTGFIHNNMQPYFGAKIRGASSNYNSIESILDNKQGTGTQIFHKSEQSPLFKPDENSNFVYGTPINTDFIQSRMNESMKMSNVSLWDQQMVGPGIGLGASTQGTDGFNAGMAARDKWLPKSVDELRVDTNPKYSYNLNGHQGPAISYIPQIGANDKIGKVEKHLPDGTFDLGPTRWFTTVGGETAPPIRSTQVMPLENRVDTTREYFGNGTAENKATYVHGEYEDSKRLGLNGLPISNANAVGHSFANPNDYASRSYNVLPNNRTTTREMPEFGGVYGIAKAALAPILDIFKPTRKENTIGNLRQTGNVNGVLPSGHIFNAADKIKVTNREMTVDKLGRHHLNVQSKSHGGDGYMVTPIQATQNQRDTTQRDYIGNAGKNIGLMPYNAVFNQQPIANKTFESRPNQGNMSVFNNSIAPTTMRNDSVANNRAQIMNGGMLAGGMIPSKEFLGDLNGMQSYDQNFNDARMDPSLLNAFKNNPYTKSLISVA